MGWRSWKQGAESSPALSTDPIEEPNKADERCRVKSPSNAAAFAAARDRGL